MFLEWSQPAMKADPLSHFGVEANIQLCQPTDLLGQAIPAAATLRGQGRLEYTIQGCNVRNNSWSGA
jgi:hypothetical protein